MILTKEEVAKLNKQRAKKLQERSKEAVSSAINNIFTSIKAGRMVGQDNLYRAQISADPEIQQAILKELKKLGFTATFSTADGSQRTKRGKMYTRKFATITIDLNV